MEICAEHRDHDSIYVDLVFPLQELLQGGYSLLSLSISVSSSNVLCLLILARTSHPTVVTILNEQFVTMLFACQCRQLLELEQYRQTRWADFDPGEDFSSAVVFQPQTGLEAMSASCTSRPST